MSINLTLVALEPSLAERLKFNPSLTEEIEIEPSRDEFLATHGLKIARTLGEDEYPFDRLSLGKDWHLLDQVFTRDNSAGLLRLIKSNNVGAFLTSGGQPIGEGAGYGPARLFSAQACGEIDTFLDEFDVSSAVEGLSIDFVVKSDVYVYSRGDVSIEEIRRIARVSIEEVKSFFRRASTTGSSAYIFLS